VSKCANYEQNKSQIYKKIDRLYIKPAFLIHKSDTFSHSQETIIGQAGAKLAISHVGGVHANTDSTRSFNIKTSAFGRL